MKESRPWQDPSATDDVFLRTTQSFLWLCLSSSLQTWRFQAKTPFHLMCFFIGCHLRWSCLQTGKSGPSSSSSNSSGYFYGCHGTLMSGSRALVRTDPPSSYPLLSAMQEYGQENCANRKDFSASRPIFVKSPSLEQLVMQQNKWALKSSSRKLPSSHHIPLSFKIDGPQTHSVEMSPCLSNVAILYCSSHFSSSCRWLLFISIPFELLPPAGQMSYLRSWSKWSKPEIGRIAGLILEKVRINSLCSII